MITVTYIDPTMIEFKADLSLREAACLRRLFLTHIPVISFGQFEVELNTSAYADETLIDRIGAIPLRNERLPSYCGDCPCPSECQECTRVYTLNVDNRSNRRQAVVSGDIYGPPENLPEDPDIFLFWLAPGQAIRLNAWAVQGTGRMGVYWNPVTRLIMEGDSPNFFFHVETDGSITAEGVLKDALVHFETICREVAHAK